MNNLISLDLGSKFPVSGRDLHMKLEIATRYNDWFKRMTDYGFSEGVDFNLLKNEQVQLEGTREVKREIVDHQLTIDMAKHVCMIQRTEIGKKIRQYFIEVEKQWNSPEAVYSRALKYADEMIARLIVKYRHSCRRIQLITQ